MSITVRPAELTRAGACRCNLSFVNAQALGGHRKHSSAHHARVLQLTAGPVGSLLCSGSSSSLGETHGLNATTKKRARGSNANSGGTGVVMNKEARHLRSKNALQSPAPPPEDTVSSPERESIFLPGLVSKKASGTHYNDAQRKVLMDYLHKEVSHVCS